MLAAAAPTTVANVDSMAVGADMVEPIKLADSKFSLDDELRRAEATRFKA